MSAGVVRLDLVLTVVALGDMAAQGGRATERDGTQGSVLLTRQEVAIALEKRVAMLAHHIGDFQRRPTQDSRSNSAGTARAARGLAVAVSAGGATWR